uniref:YubB ferredoxin-like domain-containing protein n=1 Tax=viral metagenome TaxID=1070528 RepID=A0A6C0CD98_9ZZZZ
MGNNCYIWFEVDGSNDTIDKIYQELNTIGFNGCYGFSDIQKINDGHLEVYGTTKWTPPIDMFNTWLNTSKSLKIRCLFKEEFLQFAGSWNEEQSQAELVDFTTVTSDDVRNADSGLLSEIDKKLDLAYHMDTPFLNDN